MLDFLVYYLSVVFKLGSAEPWRSVGESREFQKQVSFTVTVPNIMLIISDSIVILLPTFCTLGVGFIISAHYQK